jgi:hypothetical protein
MSRHLDNEGQECQTGPAGEGKSRMGRVNEEVKEGEYSLCTLYTCMKTGH